MYGNQIERVVLFGSRARGDARPDSDYDVAVFLSNMSDRFAELYRLADLSTDVLGGTGEFVHAMPYRSDAYDERTPLMREIRREGIELWTIPALTPRCAASSDEPTISKPLPIMRPARDPKSRRNLRRRRWKQAGASLHRRSGHR